MLKIRLSEVSDLQALCFAMLPALNCPVCDSEPVLTVLVAGGKYSTRLSKGFCCPSSLMGAFRVSWLLVIIIVVARMRLPCIRAGTFMSWCNFGIDFVLVTDIFQMFLEVVRIL